MTALSDKLAVEGFARTGWSVVPVSMRLAVRFARFVEGADRSTAQPRWSGWHGRGARADGNEVGSPEDGADQQRLRQGPPKPLCSSMKDDPDPVSIGTAARGAVALQLSSVYLNQLSGRAVGGNERVLGSGLNWPTR